MVYSIGEVAKMTGMSIHTLRFYERKGLIFPCRNEQIIEYLMIMTYLNYK